jgi:hypothetical protein
MHSTEVIENFETFPESTILENFETLIRPTVQELWPLKAGGGVSSGQIKLSGQLWTFSPLPNKIRKNLEY